MPKTSVKQLTVPENVYDEMKKLVDQASVKQDILQLLAHHCIDRTTQNTLLKGILSDISKYRGSSLLTMKGLILTLLMTKYELTSVEAFHAIESLIS